MRHLKSTKKFKRTEEERKRLWKDLVRALILNETIVTFTARAKWFRPKFERLVTLVKSAKGDTKLAYNKVRPFLDEKLSRKLIEEIAPGFEDRNGGYTIQVKVFQEFSPHDKSVVKLSERKAFEKKVLEPKPVKTEKEKTTDVVK
jgi:large subunit ribosomal protein L17